MFHWNISVGHSCIFRLLRNTTSYCHFPVLSFLFGYLVIILASACFGNLNISGNIPRNWCQLALKCLIPQPSNFGARGKQPMGKDRYLKCFIPKTPNLPPKLYLSIIWETASSHGPTNLYTTSGAKKIFTGLRWEEDLLEVSCLCLQRYLSSSPFTVSSTYWFSAVNRTIATHTYS